jgi:hypothetical protein
MELSHLSVNAPGLDTHNAAPNTFAVASTTRVFPAPVGPKNSKFPAGRPGESNPARNTTLGTDPPRLHRFVLPHDFPPQPRLEISRLHTAASGVRTAALQARPFFEPPAGPPALLKSANALTSVRGPSH